MKLSNYLEKRRLKKHFLSFVVILLKFIDLTGIVKKKQ